MWYIYTVDYFSLIKKLLKLRNKDTVGHRWTLKDHRHREVRQAEEDYGIGYTFPAEEKYLKDA